MIPPYIMASYHDEDSPSAVEIFSSPWDNISPFFAVASISQGFCGSASYCAAGIKDIKLEDVHPRS
jgi:hypothetical protein